MAALVASWGTEQLEGPPLLVVLVPYQLPNDGGEHHEAIGAEREFLPAAAEEAERCSRYPAAGVVVGAPCPKSPPWCEVDLLVLQLHCERRYSESESDSDSWHEEQSSQLCHRS